ncbi:MAG: hypothetical protein FJ298_09135 [Planctomycetes bacterium]|nr:hypothetical protein [Planctomycetota bacterium]
MLASLTLAALSLVCQVGRASASELRSELGALALREVPRAELEAGLQRIGRAGALADVELAVLLAARIDEPLLDDPTPRGAQLLRAATARLFERHALKLPRLGALLGERANPWRATLLAAVGDSRTPEAVARLGEWLAQGGEDTRETVAAIAHAARGMHGPFDERATFAVRSLLDRPGRAGHREAVLCVGWLEDEQAIDALLDLLRGSHAGLARDAQWSLERITGARLGSEASAWRRWLSEEREWRLEVLPVALDELLESDAAVQARALNEIARHRFPRHEIAERLSNRLAALDGDVFVCACAALGDMGSAAALDSLRAVSAQERSEEERRSAMAALARVGEAPSRR